MNTFSSTEERSKLLLEAVSSEIKRTKEGEDNPVQQGEVSSSKPAALANDVLGPLLLDALDGFLFVVNSQGRLVFVSENVQQFLGCSPSDLFGKSVYNIVAVRDRLKFSHNLLPLTSGGSAGSPGLGAQSQSSGGGKSKVFACRMIVKPVSAGEGSCDDKQASNYEEMHVSTVLQSFPCDQDSDSSDEKQSCLVCIARRPPLSEIHSPYASELSASDVSAVTAAAISGGMLGRKQFITKQDPTGRILDCKASYISPSQYQPSDMIGKAFQDFCHPDDAHAFSHHLQEVLKNGSGTSAVYRFKLGSSCLVFVQSRSVLASSAEASAAYLSGDSLATQSSAAVVSSHTIVRDCDIKKTDLKGAAATPSGLSKSLGLVSGSGGPAAAAAVAPLTVGGGGSHGASQMFTWPLLQQHGGSGGLLLRELPSKGLLVGSGGGDDRPLFSAVQPFDTGVVPDVNFNEYFSSSSFVGSGSSFDGCWDMQGSRSSSDDGNLQQHGSCQAPTLHRHTGGSGVLHAKIQPLPSAVVLPCKKKTPALLSGGQATVLTGSLAGFVGSDAVSGSSSPSLSSSSLSSIVALSSSSVAAMGGGSTSSVWSAQPAAAGNVRARSSPARQQPACDPGIMRELLGHADAAGGGQGGGGSSLPNGKVVASAPVGASSVATDGSAHDPESAASSPSTTTSSSAGSTCSGPASEARSDDLILRQLLSANEGSNGSGSNPGGVPVAAFSGPGSAGDSSSFARPCSGAADGAAAADRTTAIGQPSDIEHALLKKLLTDDNACSGPEKSRERNGGLLQILLKDEHDETNARTPKQQQQPVPTTHESSATSARPRAASRRASTSAGLGGDRHPSGSSGGPLSKDLSSVLSAIWEGDTRLPPGEASRAQKRKLSASAEIDSSGGTAADGSEAAATGGCARSVGAMPPTSLSAAECNSMLLNQLLQSGSGSRPRQLAGAGAIASGSAARNPQDSLPKDAKNYMVDVRVTNSGDPVLMFGGQELVESNMDKFAQITRRYGQYSDKDGSSVVGWLPGVNSGSMAASASSSSSARRQQQLTLADARNSDTGGACRGSAKKIASQSDTRTAPAAQKELSAASSSGAGHSSFLSSLYSDAMSVESASGSTNDFDGSSTLLLSQINEVHGADDDIDFVKKIDDLLGLDRSRSLQPKSCEEQLAISAIEQQLRSIEGGSGPALHAGAAGSGSGRAASTSAAGMGSSYPDMQQQPPVGARGLAATGGAASAAAGVSASGEGTLHGSGMHPSERRQPRSAAVGTAPWERPYPNSAGEYDMASGAGGMANTRVSALGLHEVRSTHQLGAAVSTGATTAGGGGSSMQARGSVRPASQTHGAGLLPSRSQQPQPSSFTQPQKASHTQAMTRPKDLYLPQQSHLSSQQHPLKAVHGAQYQPSAFGEHASPTDYGSCAPPLPPPSAAAAMPQQQQQRLDLGGQSMSQMMMMMMDAGPMPYSPSSSMAQQPLPPFQRDVVSGAGPGMSVVGMPRHAAGGMQMVRGSTSPMMSSPSASPHALQRQRSYGSRTGGLAADLSMPSYGPSLGQEPGLMFGSPATASYPQLQPPVQQQQPMMPPTMGTQPVMQRQLSASGQSLGIGGRPYDGASGGLMLPSQQQQHPLHTSAGEYGMNSDESSANSASFAGSDFSMLDSIAEQSSALQLPLSGQQQQPIHPQHVSSQYVRQELRAMCSARSQQQQQQQLLQQQQQQQQLPNLATGMETSELPQDILDQISELSSEHFTREQQQQPSNSMWPDQLGRYRQPMQQQPLHQGAYTHHMQTSPQLQRKPTFSPKPDLLAGQQQQQHASLVSARMTGYVGASMLPHTSPQQPQLSPMLPAQSVSVQQQMSMPGCLPQPGHLQSSGGGHQAVMQSQQHQMLSQQQLAVQQQQQAYLQQQQQQASIQQHLQDGSPAGECSSAGFMATHDASSIITSQKEEVRRRREQFKHKVSFQELFKSQLCQLASPPPIGSSTVRLPDMASQPSAAAATSQSPTDASGKRSGTMGHRPLVPPPVSVLQPEPRTPIEDMRPADHSNSLLQKLLSE